MYLLLIVLCVIIITWLYMKWIKMKNYWTNLGIPQTTVHPIFGSLTFLHKMNPAIFMRELYQKNQPAPYVGMWVFWRKALVINSPELARQVLVKDSDVFRNRMSGSGKSDPMGSLNLFSANDPLWSSIRKRLTLVFTASKLRGWQDLYRSKVTDLVYRINSDVENGICINLRHLFADFSTDIIGESAFGILCQATRNSTGPLREMTKEFEKYSLWRGIGWWSIFFLPELVDVFRFSLWPKHTVEYFKRVFNMVVKDRGGYDKETDGKRDLLDALLKMRQDALKDNQDMDIDILVANGMFFLQGGYDPSSLVLTYAVYELAYNPEHQQMLYEEVMEAKQKLKDKEFDSADLAELPFLDAVIKETLRKYPILGWLDRQALKDYRVDEHLTIPAKTVIYVNAVAMHRDPKYFPEPDEFRPERFMPENAKNIVPYTYMPFGEGPRMCIGKRIGQNTIRHAMSAMILNFEFQPLPKYPIPNDVPVAKLGLLHVPGIPLSVEFKPRK